MIDEWIGDADISNGVFIEIYIKWMLQPTEGSVSTLPCLHLYRSALDSSFKSPQIPAFKC
ncbi:MAG: hypothetical protein JZD41_08610 [Thermoproteus sp.]|nr:hypothetical protein [Thermoproteus sp.]